jgi:transcription elongation factor Elf1
MMLRRSGLMFTCHDCGHQIIACAIAETYYPLEFDCEKCGLCLAVRITGKAPDDE